MDQLIKSALSSHASLSYVLAWLAFESRHMNEVELEEMFKLFIAGWKAKKGDIGWAASR